MRKPGYFNIQYSVVVLVLTLMSACKSDVNAPNKPVMVLIKGGSFMMGNDLGEMDERPAHRVEVKDYYLAKYEVTKAEYDLFCSETGKARPPETYSEIKDDHPVSFVSWLDAMDYISWLNEKLNKNYRLPSEIEFEYALRAGGKAMDYSWGNGAPEKENIADESLRNKEPNAKIWESYDDGYPYLSPVGAMGFNALGLADLNGNTWEWCSDEYNAYPGGQLHERLASDSTILRVARGAGFRTDPWHTRVTTRSAVDENFKKPGFRLAMSAGKG